MSNTREKIEHDKAKLRTLGFSEMGCLQFAVLEEVQRTAIMALVDQYCFNEDGNRRIVED